MRKFENAALDFVSSVAPWLAPLIPTYFASYNAYDYLSKGHEWYDVALVVVIALVVELVGLAGVHTALQFWQWNREKNKTDDEAPLLAAIAAVLFYIVIVIAVNGSLDFFAVSNPLALPYVRIFVIAMLSLLSVNSAFILALRSGHVRRETQSKEAKEDRKKSRNDGGKKAENSDTMNGKTPEFSGEKSARRWSSVRPFMTDAELSELAKNSVEVTCKRYNFPAVDGKYTEASKRLAREWRQKAAEEMKQKVGQ